MFEKPWGNILVYVYLNHTFGYREQGAMALEALPQDPYTNKSPNNKFGKAFELLARGVKEIPKIIYRLLLLPLVTSPNLKVVPIADDTTHFGHRAWRDCGSTDMGASSQRTSSRYLMMQGKLPIKKSSQQSSLVIKHKSDTSPQHGEIFPMVPQWHFSLRDNLQVSHRAQGWHCKPSHLPVDSEVSLKKSLYYHFPKPTYFLFSK